MTDFPQSRLTPALVAAAVDLANVLARENAALARLDMTRAAAMLAEKQQAAAAFVAAQGSGAAGSRAPAMTISPAQRDAALAATARLRDLAEENRRLLERAMAVQARVLGTIAKAVPRSLAAGAPRYGARGLSAAPERMPAFALSARI
ncbi:MAG: hypothetical protein KGL12_07740 [Rhodospirillales bacterium]|nr:hypothetical protein [Rhodospirillales bacterium]